MIGDISPNKLPFPIPSENGNIMQNDFRKLNAPVLFFLFESRVKFKIPKPDDLIIQTK